LFNEYGILVLQDKKFSGALFITMQTYLTLLRYTLQECLRSSALQRLRQKDHSSKASLGYIVSRRPTQTLEQDLVLKMARKFYGMCFRLCVS
jgi:hypothetical protein